MINEVDTTRGKLENIRNHDLPIIESEEICKLLDWLQLTFLRFPKIDNYKYYETMKKIRMEIRMNKNTINKAKKFVKSKDQKNPYHNFDHILSVLSRVQENPLYQTLKDDEKLLLDLACIFHDAGHSRFNTEEENLAIAVSLVEEFRVLSGELTVFESEIISELIYSTDNRNLNFIKEDDLFLSRAMLKDADITQTFIKDGDTWRERLSEEFGASLTLDRDFEFINSITLLTPFGRRIVEEWKKRKFKGGV